MTRRSQLNKVKQATALPPSELGRRASRDHIVILDGTLSSLKDGCETNAGLTFKLLKAQRDVSVFYEPGLQWQNWRDIRDVALGRGINRQIRRAYGFLAMRYQPGDRIFFLGYSRGAYAVRSLAGVIDQVGLLRADQATSRQVRKIYHLYQCEDDAQIVRRFARVHCHPSARIEMVGVWDTVKALGLRLPALWRLTEARHAFHNHELGESIRHGFHALAYDETRQAFSPVLWDCPQDWRGVMEQVWFRGTHGDVGGQLDGLHQCRPLSNIPLTWMLSKLALLGLSLPEGWEARFPCDPHAPSIGKWAGMSKLFLLRTRRTVGKDPSETLHPSLVLTQSSRKSAQERDKGSSRKKQK